MKNYTLLITGLLLSQLLFSQVQKGADIDGITAWENFGLSTAISADGNTIVTSGRYNSTPMLRAGLVKVYQWG